MKPGKHSPIVVAKRVLFLAYSASRVLGMGRFQARENATEEDVWNAAYSASDYAGSPDLLGKPGLLRADYVFGRSIKLVIRWDDTNLSLRCMDDEALWLTTQVGSVGPSYSSVEALLEKALQELDQ